MGEHFGKVRLQSAHDEPQVVFHLAVDEIVLCATVQKFGISAMTEQILFVSVIC